MVMFRGPGMECLQISRRSSSGSFGKQVKFTSMVLRSWEVWPAGTIGLLGRGVRPLEFLGRATSRGIAVPETAARALLDFGLRGRGYSSVRYIENEYQHSRGLFNPTFMVATCLCACSPLMVIWPSRKVSKIVIVGERSERKPKQRSSSNTRLDSYLVPCYPDQFKWNDPEQLGGAETLG